MSTDLTLHATLTTGMHFEVETVSGHHLALDDREQTVVPSPMETLLAALAGCSGISMLSILRKKRQDMGVFAYPPMMGHINHTSFVTPFPP